MRWRNGGGGFDGVEKEVWRFLFFGFGRGELRGWETCCLLLGQSPAFCCEYVYENEYCAALLTTSGFENSIFSHTTQRTER